MYFGSYFTTSQAMGGSVVRNVYYRTWVACPVTLPTMPDSQGMDGMSMLEDWAKCLGAVRVFGEASLWDHPLDFCDQKGNGKTVGTKTSTEFTHYSL